MVISWGININGESEGAFWNAGNIVYLDLDGSDMGVNVLKFIKLYTSDQCILL